MKYRVRYKQSGLYLMSPSKLAQVELWGWDRSVAKAHHFDSRADAKKLLREIGPQYPIRDFSFEKVEDSDV